MSHSITIKKIKKHILKKSSLLVLAFAISILGLASFSSGVFKGSEVSAALPDGETFVVNSIGDNPDAFPGDNSCETTNPGECTLRAALDEASTNNNPSFRDVINFTIPGAGVHTISPSTGFFGGNESVIINGYSQPGASANSAVFPNPLNGTLLIELDFSNLTTANEAGLQPGSGFTMQGLVLNRNPVGNTIGMYEANDVSISGNYFNTDSTGLIARPGGLERQTIGINGSSDIHIGGSSPQERNIFGRNGGNIYMYAADPSGAQASNVSIKGNYFGVGADGITNMGTLSLAHIALGDSTTDISIGGPNPEDGNFFENSAQSAIGIGDSGEGESVQRVLVQHNRIVGNSYMGLAIGSYNAPYAAAQNISILENSMYLNGTLADSSGIDLILPVTGSGINPNDDLDADSGSNGLLNYPTYREDDVIESGGNTDIDYSLDVPAGDYRIEFFSSPTADSNGREGYEFIGYQNVSSLGSGSQTFSNTLSGIGYQNITMTATEINPDLPSGFGATSEFGGSRPRASDLGITKDLLNPEDVAQGSTLNYHITLKNNGPDALALAEYSTPLVSTPITYDYMPPDLTPTDIIGDGPIPGSSFVDVGNSDLTCLWAGPGSAGTFGTMTSARYSSYSFMACWYTGSDSDLADGGTIELDVNTEIASDSELALINFAYILPTLNSGDPDLATLASQSGSGEDGLDGLYRSNAGQGGAAVNNFAISSVPVNLDVSAQLVNPEDVQVGNTINYDVTITNNGTTGADLANYVSPSQNLLAGAFAAPKLTLVGTPNANVTCGSAGPGSIAYWGAAGSNHPGYAIFFCMYNGPKQIIAPGESYVLRLQMTVDDASDFSFYAIQSGTFSDPDAQGITDYFATATEDVLDTIVNPNFARVAYVNGAVDNGEQGNGNGNGQSGGGGGSNSSFTNNGLSNTGQNVLVLIVSGVILVGLAALIYKKSRKPKTSLKA